VSSDAPLTPEQLTASQLPYLNGVLYEALRLFPPVPEDSKFSVNDDVLPDGTKFPASTRLVFFPYLMGRDPQRYSNPLECRPERWIPFKQPSQFEFPVFQGGPRICLGQNMALFEAKALAVQLLQRFSFQLLAGEKDKISYSTMITMSLVNSTDCDSHNLWLLPTPRTQ